MIDATDYSTAEILEQTRESYARLESALKYMLMSDLVDAQLYSGLLSHIQALSGATEVLSARAMTPEDIIR